ncbi:MAG: hypothetical protein J7L07_03600 [Candidatus Odinarchaeota archaeon]|nr:hypothetical protein [Candidatus Odinarchaeota archaeon]
MEDKGIITVLLPLQRKVYDVLNEVITNVFHDNKGITINVALESLYSIYDYLFEYNKLESSLLEEELRKHSSVLRRLQISEQREILQEKIKNLQKRQEMASLAIWRYNVYRTTVKLISKFLKVEDLPDLSISSSIDLEGILFSMRDLIKNSSQNIQDKISKVDGIRLLREILIDYFLWKSNKEEDARENILLNLLEKLSLFFEDYIIRLFEKKEWKIWLAIYPFEMALTRYIFEYVIHSITYSLLKKVNKNSLVKNQRLNLYFRKVEILKHDAKGKYYKLLGDLGLIYNRKVAQSLLEKAISEFELCISLSGDITNFKRNNAIWLRNIGISKAQILINRIFDLKKNILQSDEASGNGGKLIADLNEILEEIDEIKQKLIDGDLKTFLTEEEHIIHYLVSEIQKGNWRGIKENIEFAEKFRSYTLTQRIRDLLNDAKDEVDDVINAKSARKVLELASRALKLLRISENIQEKELLINLSKALMMTSRYLLVYRNSDISDNDFETIRFRVLEHIFSNEASRFYKLVNEKNLEEVHRDLANLALGDGAKYAERILVEHANQSVIKCKDLRELLYRSFSENKICDKDVKDISDCHNEVIEFLKEISKISQLRLKSYNESKESNFLGKSIKKLIDIQEAALIFYNAEIERFQGAKDDALHECYAHLKNWSKAYTYCDSSVNNFRSAYTLYKRASTVFNKLGFLNVSSFCEKMSQLCYLMAQQNWENIKRISDGELPLLKERKLLLNLYRETLVIQE